MMKQIDNYILEKLHIDKDTKLPDHYKNDEFVDAIKDFMAEYVKSNSRLTSYVVTKEEDNKIFISTNPDFRIYYPELKKYILNKFDSLYEINKINWDLAKSIFIIYL